MDTVPSVSCCVPPGVSRQTGLAPRSLARNFGTLYLRTSEPLAMRMRSTATANAPGQLAASCCWIARVYPRPRHEPANRCASNESKGGFHRKPQSVLLNQI